MGTVLDPRFKFQIFKVAYDRIDPTTSQKKVDLVKENFYLLFKEYNTKSVASSSSKYSSTPNPRELLSESPLKDDLTNDLFELEKSLQRDLDNTKMSLDMDLADRDVLSYWKENQQCYGDLATLACDVLSILITIVAFESGFSVGGRVLNPFRSRLLPKNVQALICTRNWLRGFAEFEGDIEDYFDDEDNDATKMASSSGVGELSI